MPTESILYGHHYASVHCPLRLHYYEFTTQVTRTCHPLSALITPSSSAHANQLTVPVTVALIISPCSAPSSLPFTLGRNVAPISTALEFRMDRWQLTHPSHCHHRPCSPPSFHLPQLSVTPVPISAEHTNITSIGSHRVPISGSHFFTGVLMFIAYRATSAG